MEDSRPAPDRRLRRVDLDRRAAVVQRQDRNDRLLVVGGMAAGAGGHGPPGPRRDGAHGGRGGHRSRRPVLRAGELVPRRRVPDAVRHLALLGPEHAATDVSPGRVPGRHGAVVRILRPRGRDAESRVDRGDRAPAADRHPERGRRPPGHVHGVHAAGA